ncbi:hypothetical protein [Paraburkholderia mimosarum]|uniref:hypothetical protein n=1 Tax=Paraburkholderia mimosarum TaxID=312026 RepID=UPI0012DCDD93|nr:hypothetical protein [Paraburkholderia mimosarum]
MNPLPVIFAGSFGEAMPHVNRLTISYSQNAYQFHTLLNRIASKQKYKVNNRRFSPVLSGGAKALCNSITGIHAPAHSVTRVDP